MTPYYDEGGITIYHGDCRDVLQLCRCVPGLRHADSCISGADLVLTDPPYGIGDRWAKSAMIGRNGSSRLWGNGETWDDAPPDAATIRLVIAAGKRVIIWGGNYFGLPPSRCWLVWDKVQKFTGADAELAWTNLDAPVRVWRLSRIAAFGNNAESVKQHPTEKPITLMRWCLDLAGGDGTVLDPFMGSGTTLRAAKDFGRRAIGIEIEEKYCEIAARRLAQEVLAL